MTNKLKWKVIRQHEGDRFYSEGDIREGTKAELGHLEGTCLELVGPVVDEVAAAAKAAADKKAADDAAAAKAAADKKAADDAAGKGEPAPLNKAEGAAPANKAAISR